VKIKVKKDVRAAASAHQQRRQLNLLFNSSSNYDWDGSRPGFLGQANEKKAEERATFFFPRTLILVTPSPPQFSLEKKKTITLLLLAAAHA